MTIDNNTQPNDFDRPKVIRAVTAFLLQPRRFAKLASEHDFARAHKSADYPEHWRSQADVRAGELEERARGAAAELRRSFWVHGFMIGFALFSAFLGAKGGQWLVGNMPSWLNLLLQAVGAALLLWATLWQLDPQKKTQLGMSMVERTHGWLFRTMYMLATFLLFLAYFWPVGG